MFGYNTFSTTKDVRLPCRRLAWLLTLLYMHGVLAIKASVPDYFHPQAKTSVEALEHLSKAYRLTRSKVAGSEVLSDRKIACVTILAIYQLVYGNVDIGLLHFEGLCCMVRLRGGLATLVESNRALAQKPWR